MNRQTVHRRLPTLGLLTSLFVWPALAMGQVGSRDISGTVTDHQHEPLKRAVVQAENVVTLGVRSYITSRDGKYSFKRLYGDTDYRLWVNFRGNKSLVRKVSRFDSNRPKIIDFVMDLH